MHLSKELDKSIQYTCEICIKNIDEGQKVLTCNLCHCKIHAKCNNLKLMNNVNRIDNRYEYPVCSNCKENTLPFQKEYNNEPNTNKMSEFNLRLFLNSINDTNKTYDSGNHHSDIEENSNLIINSDYIDAESFSYKENKDNLSLFHLNIASLSKHKEELEALFDSLNFKFDIIALSESKIKKGISPIFDIDINGYNCFNTPTEAASGGTVLYISNILKCKPRKDLENLLYKSKHLESTFVEIVNPGKKNIICGCIYKHPSMDIEEFNDNHINLLLNKLIGEEKKVFLLGDFNIDLLKINENNAVSNFLDLLSSQLFVPHIVQASRISMNNPNYRLSETLIDNIYSNALNFADGKSGNLTISISDHFAQFLIIPIDISKHSEKSNWFKRDTKNFDKVNFILDLLSLNWDEIIDIDKNDPNFSFNAFENNLMEVIDRYMPLKKATKNEIKQKSKPWITKGITTSIKQRDKFYKKYMKTKDAETKQAYHLRYKQIRNHIVQLIRVSKKDYFKIFFQKNINNIKNTWAGIKNIIKVNSKSNKSGPTSLLINNQLVTDPKEVGNQFNQHFTSIATKLQEKIHNNGQDFTKYLDDRNDNTMVFFPTETNEVSKLISLINEDKASGPHSIPSNIMKYINPIISSPLTKIINLSFKTGIYLDNLKVSKVIPIFKDKGDKLDYNNYRPISLLSNVNKIIEKLMHKRLSKFLSKYNCLYELQFGFRKYHSTTHALMYLTETIRKTLDKNSFACGIFIDLQKAFDTVDHTLLLHKLCHYGVRGIENAWFKSYLSNRRQFTSINGTNSVENNIKHGVPQGSVLGPLLFLVYINDLNKSLKYCSAIHFADDTVLMHENKSLEDMEKNVNFDLKNINDWLIANKISLNANKTEMVLFRNHRKKIDFKMEIKIADKIIEMSDVVKYLGIYIDKHLNWKHHVQITKTKLARAVGMLSKIRHFVPRITLRVIYHSIFSSHLMYGSQIWGQTQDTNLAQIARQQNKAMRIINFAPFDAPSEALYRASDILKFSENINLLNLLFVYDRLNDKHPLVMKNIFNFLRKTHKYLTRNSEYRLKLPKVKTTTYGLNSIEYKCISVWNSMILKFDDNKLNNLNKNDIISYIKNDIRV